MTTIRAHFDGKVFVPHGPLDLPEGSEVEMQVTEVQPKRGSPASVLRAMNQPPFVTKEDVDALELEIERGNAPPTTKGVFDEE